MKIREAIKKDAAKMAEVQIKAWRVGYKGIMPDKYLSSLSIEHRTKKWQEALSNNDPGTNIVIEYKNVVSGFCVYGPARDEDLLNLKSGELVALNILPGKWSLGLGTELIKNVIEAAYIKEWKSLYLWVVKENNRARKLYELFGFEIEGKEKVDFKLTGCELHEIRYIKSMLTKS